MLYNKELFSIYTVPYTLAHSGKVRRRVKGLLKGAHGFSPKKMLSFGGSKSKISIGQIKGQKHMNQEFDTTI